MTALQIALLKLQLEEAPPLLNLALAEAEQAIKNYCNYHMEEELPQELWFIWGEMATGLYTQWMGEAVATVAGNLTSVRMGDTSYGFAANGKSTQEYLADIISNYPRQLNRFRRLIWP